MGAVATLVDGVRVRSRPRIADDSALLNPLLPAGTRLYVLDGPVAASGYDWYEVVPLASSTLPNGWIASAARDGTQWIGPSPSPSCPAVPTTMRALASLGTAVGLHCFARIPITVRARLIGCNCNIDGSWYEPYWFYLGSGSPKLLVDPDVSDVLSDRDEWFALNLDPAGEHPDVLPLGEVVEVTGLFDHPAAATCTRTEMDGEPVPTAACRLEFGVTRLLVFGP
jgi:hypothetical protein